MANQITKPALAAAETDRIGFFGKVPSHGDFISEGLERDFIGALDEWLRAGMHACADTLSSKWANTFSSSPPRRFIVERGVWGNSTFAGVLLPSRDRVGRKFPLVIIAQLTSFKQHPRSLYLDETWFMAAEALAETSMAGDFDIARFTTAIKRLRLPKPREDDDDISPTRNSVPSSLWWYIDPESRKVRGVKFEGKPKTHDFVRLFQDAANGLEKKEGQQNLSTAKPKVGPAEAVSRVPPVRHVATPSMQIVYSYATHAGTQLSANADSLFVSKDPSLFALADGLGNGTGAIEAARLTTSIMADVTGGGDAESLAQQIRGKLGTANTLLLSRAVPESAARPMASVVTASFFGNVLTLLWSGDARAYLVKDGTMHLLTRDHVIVGLKKQLSQCVGHPQHFRPDVVRENWEPENRLLLCSFGLIQSLKERVVAEVIADTPIKDCANTLVQEALIANARENISAIVIGNTRER